MREAFKNKDLGKEEIEKLNIAEKRLDAVDKLSKALRKHGLQREFFTTLGAMDHFLAAPPVAKMNTPSFIVQKRVEHNVNESGLDPDKLANALGSNALESAGIPEAERETYQMKLLEEITVVCSREHDPVQPALEKVFPKLATAEGILPNNLHDGGLRRIG